MDRSCCKNESKEAKEPIGLSSRRPQALQPLAMCARPLRSTQLVTRDQSAESTPAGPVMDEVQRLTASCPNTSTKLFSVPSPAVGNNGFADDTMPALARLSAAWR